MVPQLVTLNELKQYTDHYLSVISSKSVTLGATYIVVVEVNPILSAIKMNSTQASVHTRITEKDFI